MGSAGMGWDGMEWGWDGVCWDRIGWDEMVLGWAGMHDRQSRRVNCVLRRIRVEIQLAIRAEGGETFARRMWHKGCVLLLCWRCTRA